MKKSVPTYKDIHQLLGYVLSRNKEENEMKYGEQSHKKKESEPFLQYIMKGLTQPN